MKNERFTNVPVKHQLYCFGEFFALKTKFRRSSIWLDHHLFNRYSTFHSSSVAFDRCSTV